MCLCIYIFVQCVLQELFPTPIYFAGNRIRSRYTTVGKNQGKFFYDIKNVYLFIQINFIPFKVIPSKVIPSRYNPLMPTFFPIVETLVCVEFLAKWSRRTSAVWDGALSWCKNHELSAQNIFWNSVEWSSWNSNSVSKVSNCQSTIFVH